MLSFPLLGDLLRERDLFLSTSSLTSGWVPDNIPSSLGVRFDVGGGGCVVGTGCGNGADCCCIGCDGD